MKRSVWTSVALLSCMATAQAALPSGAGDYVFRDASGAEIPIYYYTPETQQNDTPVVMVLHGLKRDAEQYRDAWIDAAARHGLTILAPTFTRDLYPGANGYHLGNVFHAVSDDELRGRTKPEQVNPKTSWSFSLPDAVFEDYKKRQGTNAQGYTLYGHGAGAQFAHRYALFYPTSSACQIIAANSGWYTFPDRSVEWPYGISEVAILDDDAIDAALEAPLHLLLGTDDTARTGVLRKTEEADAQGPNRKVRGENFFAYTQKLAQDRAIESGWQLSFISDAAHQNNQMVDATAAIIQTCPQP